MIKRREPGHQNVVSPIGTALPVAATPPGPPVPPVAAVEEAAAPVVGNKIVTGSK